MVPTTRKSAPSASAWAAAWTECTDRPTSAPLPTAIRAALTGNPSSPNWTPWALAARATSARSFTIRRARRPITFKRDSASSNNWPPDRSFSLSCTRSTPPWTAWATRSTRSPEVAERSVTKHRQGLGRESVTGLATGRYRLGNVGGGAAGDGFFTHCDTSCQIGVAAR